MRNNRLDKLEEKAGLRNPSYLVIEKVGFNRYEVGGEIMTGGQVMDLRYCEGIRIPKYIGFGKTPYERLMDMLQKAVLELCDEDIFAEGVTDTDRDDVLQMALDAFTDEHIERLEQAIRKH